MSNQKDINELVRQLEAKGWRVTHGGKHRKLIAPSGKKITAPGSVSDHRGFLNFRADIRRALALEESLAKPKLFRLQQAPPPDFKLDDDPPELPITARKEEPMTTAPTHKVLTTDLLARIMALRNDNVNQRDIADLLNKEGYRNKHGSRLDQSSISFFLRAHNVRSRPEYVKGAKREAAEQAPVLQAPAHVVPQAKGLLGDVEDLVSSNLSPELKEKFLKSLLKGN